MLQRRRLGHLHPPSSSHVTDRRAMVLKVGAAASPAYPAAAGPDRPGSAPSGRWAEGPPAPSAGRVPAWVRGAGLSHGGSAPDTAPLSMLSATKSTSDSAC